MKKRYLKKQDKLKSKHLEEEKAKKIRSEIVEQQKIDLVLKYDLLKEKSFYSWLFYHFL